MHGLFAIGLVAAIICGCLSVVYNSVKDLGAAEATAEIRSELVQKKQEVDEFHDEIQYDFSEWEADEAEVAEEIQEETNQQLEEIYDIDGPIYCPDLENYLDCELPWPEDK